MEALGRTRKWHEARGKRQRRQSSRREYHWLDSVEQYPRHFSEAACALQENGRDVPKSQELARMSKKARKWQGCLRKPRNGEDVQANQEMAEASGKVNQ
ncbi:hypothetical protein Taro_022132 [Colocasia esculenta]|uniref:Uncharacterized protein n=1 Tax=Colocasia esculenta TaxID=4460 RepID=A0A843V721_COLES|nr:hypothetical protein [Colocasia esculenta]